MNGKISVLKSMVLTGLLLTIQPAWANLRRSDHVVRRNETVKRSIFYGNPLVLNKKQLDYVRFSIVSRGKLALMEGDPESKEATKVPFCIYLRRAGAIITKGVSDMNRQVYDIEIATVLALAQPGDDLVIDPVRKMDCLAKRVLKVKQLNSLLPPNWLNWSSPGC